MAEKEKIKESLQNIIDNIGEFESGDIDWYYDQVVLGDDDDGDYRSIDQQLMTKAFKYTDLHPLMREVVKAISETNVQVGEIWDQDEEHAGTNAALLLALANKEDVLLYAQFIATNDLNHPVYQEEDWDEVFDKWKECEETLRLLITISLIPGQYFETDSYWDDFAAFLKKGDNINLFLKQLHFFIMEGNRLGIYFRDVEEFLKERLPQLLEGEIAANEKLVEYIIDQFIEYPEVPEPPTLTVLMSGYEE